MPFDPDAYLAAKAQAQPAPAFDPDAYLAKVRAGSEQPTDADPTKSVRPGITAQTLAFMKNGLFLDKPTDFGKTARNMELGLAGVGRGMANLARGAGQTLGLVPQEAIQEAKRLDAPLLNTTPGAVGNAIGTIAPMLPTAFIPGANTYTGAATIGAGTGLLDPVAEGDVLTGKLKSAATGAAIGAGGQAVGQGLARGYGLARNMVDNFTDSGSARLAAQRLQELAGGADNLAGAGSYRPATPGVKASLAEATLNPGIASTELARSSDPVFKTALRGQQDANRLAIINALDEMRGGSGGAGITAARNARDDATGKLYREAFDSDVMRRNIAAQQLKARAEAITGGIGTPEMLETARTQLADDLSTPGIRSLVERPAFRQAVKRAKRIAGDKGVRLADPLTSLEGLHYTKLAIDDMLEPSAMNALGRNSKSALTDIKNQLVNEIGKLSPDYDAARTTYQAMSKPVNQMEVVDSIYNKFVPALTEKGLTSAGGAGSRVRANSYAQALRNARESVKGITGFDTTLDDVMTPQQLRALEGIEGDLSRSAAADALAASKGSPTNQNEVINALLDLGKSKIPGGNTVLKIGKALSPQSRVNDRIAEMLLDPEAYIKGAGIQQTDVGPLIEALRLRGINPALLGANASE